MSVRFPPGQGYKLTILGPCGLIALPVGQVHFHWAKSGKYITQVIAIGPLGLHYADLAIDPRNHNQGRVRIVRSEPQLRGQHSKRVQKRNNTGNGE